MSQIHILRGVDPDARARWILKLGYTAFFPKDFDEFMHICAPHSTRPKHIVINAENLDLHDIAPYAAYAKAMRINCTIVTFVIADAKWGISEEEAIAMRAKIWRLKAAHIPEQWGIKETIVQESADNWWDKGPAIATTVHNIIDAVRTELRRPYPSIQRLKALVDT